MKTIKRSVLLATSAKTDVKRSGGVVSITGLNDVKESEIVSIKQIKQKAEVAQVYTIGSSSYTPIADTEYIVRIGDANATREGFQKSLQKFSYKTPSVITQIGATAALQREYIHAQIMKKIYAQAGNINIDVTGINTTTYVSNGTYSGSNGTGTGIKLVDKTGYYPVRVGGGSGGRKGANSVELGIDPENGLGWDDSSTDKVLTRAAVYSFGDGTKLAQGLPVIHFYSQNLISGEYDTPLTTTGAAATGGQLYDAFAITSLVQQSAHSVSGQIAYGLKEQAVFVDNGLGTATTNLAGYKAFRREMHRLLFNLYRNDPNSVIDFFGKPIMVEGALGAAPATTGTYKLLSEEMYQATQVGTQTIVAPIISDDGLLLDQDLTDTEGSEITPSILTNDVREFVVGKQAFSVYAELKAADCTDVGFLLGFRKKAAYAADFNNYTDMAGIGSIATVAGATPDGDLISTHGILNNAATVSTSTAIVPADTVSYTMEILVDIAGLVTAKVNGVAYPIYSAGTTALILDAGDVMIPFLRSVNIGGGDPDAVLIELVAIADNTWKI